MAALAKRAMHAVAHSRGCNFLESNAVRIFCWRQPSASGSVGNGTSPKISAIVALSPQTSFTTSIRTSCGAMVTNCLMTAVRYHAPSPRQAKTGHFYFASTVERQLLSTRDHACNPWRLCLPVYCTVIEYAGEQYCWPPVTAQTSSGSGPVTPAGTATLTCCTPGTPGASPA